MRKLLGGTTAALLALAIAAAPAFAASAGAKPGTSTIVDIGGSAAGATTSWARRRTWS